MKILIMANSSGGLYDFRGDLISQLAKNNEIIVSTPDNEQLKDTIEELGCKLVYTSIQRRGMNPIKDFSLLKQYLKIIKNFKPDLVITYTIKPNIYGGIACRILHIQYAANITGLGSAFQNNGLLKKLVIHMYKLSLKMAQTVFFENIENKQILSDNKIINEEQCCVLNGAGVNLEKFAKSPYPNNVTTRFLFIGRIMKEKGIDELLNAAKRIKEEYSNVFFDIVGPYEDNYEKIIKELEQQGIVEYHGYQEDVRPFIEKCHCFVLPSYHEGMANTNLECGAMGRPIITSSIHGCLEAVIDGESGFLAEPRNSDDLYKKLKKFIELPYEKKTSMAKASHKHIADNFNKKDVVEKTIKRLFN